MSSTNWSWPSPTASRMPRKKPYRSGSDWISFIRSSMSGMMLIRAMLLNLRGCTTSAVPSQLLPT